MLSATSRVPLAAAWTPCAMLWVAVPCCSTADEIDVVISLIRSIVSPIALIALTDSPVARCMLTMCAMISSVALAVWPPQVLTHSAATGPCGPEGCIEREEIGLFRNRCDQLHHVADPIAGCRQFRHPLVRCVGLLDRVGGNAIRLLNSAADLNDRLRQPIRSGRGVADMLGSLPGGIGGLSRHLRR